MHWLNPVQSALAFSIAIGIGLILAAFTKEGTDIGKYEDTFFTPDKIKHAIGSGITVVVGYYIFSCSLRVALLLSLAGWIILEIEQAIIGKRQGKEVWKFMWRDIIADIVGALIVSSLILVSRIE